MTSPGGMNFEIGADATRAINELRRVTEEAERTRRALERVQRIPPPTSAGNPQGGRAFTDFAGRPLPQPGYANPAVGRFEQNRLADQTLRAQQRELQERRLIERALLTQRNAEQRIAAARIAEAARIEAQRRSNNIPILPGGGGFGGGGFGGGAGGGAGSGGGGFFGDLRKGFKEGRGDAPVGYQIGQVFRTSLLYSSAFQVIRGVKAVFEDVLKEGILFQTSITELALATDQTRDVVRGLATSLGDEANKYGFSGSAGVRAGTRALGVFGALDDPGRQGAVARSAGNVVLQQSFLSGKDTDELTSNLAAIIQAFGLGAEQIQRITDTTAFFEKNFGLAVGSLQDSMPAIASLAKQTGFSLEETAGLAAAVQTRQAGTPAAASGLLSQILTREGEGTVQAIFDEFEIVGASFRDRFEGLSKALPNLSELERGRVAATFGRGRSQSAAIGLLEELPKIFRLAERAGGPEAVGLNDRQAAMRLNDIGGQLRQFAGAMKGFSAEIGRSGLLTAVGALAVSIREATEVTTSFLRVWNMVPSAVKAVLISMAALALANRVGAGAFLTRRYTSAIATNTGRIGPMTQAQSTIRGASAGAGAGAITRSGLATLGLTPVTAALLGLGVAAGVLKGSFDKVAESSQKARDALLLTSDVQTDSVEALKGALASATTAKEDRDKSRPFWADRIIGNLMGGGADDARRKEVGLLETREAAIQARIVQLEANVKNANPTEGGAFGDLSKSSVEKGYESLRSKGFSAAQSMGLLGRALDETAQSTADAVAAFDALRLAQNFELNLETNITDGIKDAFYKPAFERPKSFQNDLNAFENKISGGALGKDYEANYAEITDSFLKMLPDPTAIRAKLLELVEARESGGITNAEDTEIANALFAFMKEADPKKYAEIVAEFGAGNVQAFEQGVRSNFKKVIASETASTRGQDPETGEFLTRTFQARDTTRRGMSEATAQAATGGSRVAQAAALRQEIDALQQIIRDTPRSGKYSPADDILKVRELEIEAAKLEVARLKDATGALLAQGKISGSGVLKAAQSTLNESVQKHAVAGDHDALRELLVNASKATVAIARKAYLKFLELKYAQQLAESTSGRETDGIRALFSKDLAEFNDSVTTAEANSDGKKIVDAAIATAKAAGTKDTKDDRAADLQTAKAELDKVAKDHPVRSKAYQDALGRVNAAQLAITEDVVDDSLAIAQSFNDLRAARIGGGIAAAEAELKNAQLALQDAGDDILKRNQALIGIENAQNEAIEAALAFRRNKDLLSIDLTNPVQEAAAAVRAAKAKLSSNLVNKRGKDIIAQDRLDLRQARNARKDAAFNQFLSDEQTDLDLGRQSQSEFLRDLKSKDNLLKAEQAGLDKTSNGYRALKEKRDQLAKIIKDAAEGMSSQFNLGDITLPTPFEARRYAQRVMGGGSGTSNGNSTQITINGADTGQVIQILSQYMGSGNVYTTGSY